jgi:hypothetical protein
MMPRNQVVPIADLARRAPEAGRIRIGKKVLSRNKKMIQASITTFRFTSQHRDLIELLAAELGGTVEPWDDPKSRIRNQFQVETKAKEIAVYLPRDGLNQTYEMWSGGGCLRRCDGLIVETVEMHGENAAYVQSPCICDAKGQLECRPYTRITVVIPWLPFAGTWRLETKGWNAAAEVPGMFEMVRNLHEGGRFVNALLSVEQRTDITGGQTRQFVVPKISVVESPLEIQQGAAVTGAISAGGTRELAPTTRGELVTGELVDGDDITMIIGLLRADAEQFGLDPDRFVAALETAPGGIDAHGARVHADIVGMKIEPRGFDGDGRITWERL